MLHVLSEEASPCCSKAWEKALIKGLLDDAKSWECPKCGCEYSPSRVGAIMHWEYSSGARLVAS